MIIIAFCAIVIPLMFFLIYKYRNTVGSNKTVSTLFEDFKCDRYLRMIYYPLFFLRRLLYISGIVFLSDYPLLQVIMNSSFSFLSVVYVFIVKPFEKIQKQILNCANEIFLLIVFIVTGLSLLDFSDDKAVTIAIVFSLGTMLLVIGNLILMMWLGVVKLKEKCKKADNEDSDAREKDNFEDGREEEVENNNENNNMTDVLRLESLF